MSISLTVSEPNKTSCVFWNTYFTQLPKDLHLVHRFCY